MDLQPVLVLAMLVCLSAFTWLVTYSVMKGRRENALQKLQTELYGRWVMELTQLKEEVTYSALEYMGNPVRRRLMISWSVEIGTGRFQTEHGLLFLDESEFQKLEHARQTKGDLRPVHFTRSGSTLKIVYD